MKSKSILIVEDEPNIAEVVSLYLKRADYQVRVAKDGMTAMSILEEHIPDLIIMDIMLPEVDGFAITRWLRERSNVPIIMLTARRDEIDRISTSSTFNGTALLTTTSLSRSARKS